MSLVSHLTSPEAAAAAAAGRLLTIPLGATEQHGPHLPLTTDADIATALVEGLRQARDEVVAAPVLPFGASGEHDGFPGTLSIGEEATELLLVELGRSATLTFGRVLFVSAHGGNAKAIRQAVRKLRAEARDVRAWSPKWLGDAHAGRTETSLMLHIDAARVQSDRAAAGNVSPIGELLLQLRRGGVAAVSRNGVLGDPTSASAAEGAVLLAAAIAELCGWVSRWPIAETAR